jgi:hypothetical protein
MKNRDLRNTNVPRPAQNNESCSHTFLSPQETRLTTTSILSITPSLSLTLLPTLNRSDVFPRIVKESNNKIRLTGSWLTEIGELDTAGKYFISHTLNISPFFEYPVFFCLDSHCLRSCKVQEREMALTKGHGSQELQHPMTHNLRRHAC